MKQTETNAGTESQPGRVERRVIDFQAFARQMAQKRHEGKPMRTRLTERQILDAKNRPCDAAMRMERIYSRL